MRKRIASSFARKSPYYRYLYFILSSVRLWSYATWKEAGEPNPFAKSYYTDRSATRSELVSLFRSRLNSCL